MLPVTPPAKEEDYVLGHALWCGGTLTPSPQLPPAPSGLAFGTLCPAALSPIHKDTHYKRGKGEGRIRGGVEGYIGCIRQGEETRGGDEGRRQGYVSHHQLEESASNAVSTYCLSATILSLSLPEGSGVLVLEV